MSRARRLAGRARAVARERKAGADTGFPIGRHARAQAAFAALRAFPDLPERESRLCELVEYFGWEIGHRAAYATPWFYEDDPRRRRYEAQLGVEDTWTREILHMYALFNRMDPERHDLFWIFDGLLSRLDSLGGPQRLSVLDFGAGLGQIGLAFCSAGYRTVMSERIPAFCDFFEFLAANRGLKPEIDRAGSWDGDALRDETYYDTAADPRDFGLVVEWSVFEHVEDTIGSLERITGGLVPGGMFVTTTFKKDWTPELVEHYRRDSQDEAIASQYLSPEVEAWLDARFAVVSPPRTIAKILIKR